MKAVACWIMVTFLSSVAAADIIAWQDADGVRHYTNLKDEVPKDQRESARVVVDEVVRRPSSENSPGQDSGGEESRPHPQAAEPRRQAEVIYERSQLANAYLEGLRRGLDAAPGVGGAEGGRVQINGPLAVANATGPTPYSAYVSPYYYPFVTTSFDRGRSRHLTLRMLLQDQFAFDRETPFVFEERLIPPLGHPPLGVNLNPFLPRGLPHAFPRGPVVVVR